MAKQKVGCWEMETSSTASASSHPCATALPTFGTVSPSHQRTVGDAAGVSHPPAPVLHREGLSVGPPPTDVVHHVEPGTHGGMTCSAANVHRRGKATSRKRASFAHSAFFVSNNRSVTRNVQKIYRTSPSDF